MLPEFMLALIRSGGVQMLSVRPYKKAPTFCYTIGHFLNHGLPELLLVGVPYPRAGLALAEFGRRLDRSSKRRDDDAWHLTDSDLLVRSQRLTLPRIKKYMLWAVNFYGGADFPAVEVVAVPAAQKSA